MKRFSVIIVAIALLVCMAMPVSAATEEAPLEYIDTQMDVVFWVSWDVKIPYIVFLAPDGTEYDPMVQYGNTTTIMSDTALYFVVMDAPAGQWNIRYDKGENTEIEVSIQDYSAPLYIEHFTLGQVEGNRIPVEFLVAGEEGTYFNYKISAVIDHTGAEKELHSGSSRVGRDESLNVYLNELSSYSAYMLKLYVWYDDNGADIFDFVFSDPFSYTNENLDAEAKDFELTVVPDDSLLYVTVPDLGWNVDSFMVAVFENGAAEPAMFKEYSRDEANNLQLAYDPASTEVAVEVTVKINGVNASPVRKTFDPNNFGISIPEGEAFNSLVLPMNYTGMAQQLVNVSVNGYNNELVLDGDGGVNITLGDDWNDLAITFIDANHITWMLAREIFVDRVAPVLNMSQMYDGMTAEENHLVISGSVSDYHKLTINGESVSVDANGLFSQEVSLSTGANSVEVVASDKLGNETRYTAVIYHGVDAEEWIENETNKESAGGLLETLTSPGSYWVLLIASVLCLLIIGYALIFWRKEAKK